MIRAAASLFVFALASMVSSEDKKPELTGTWTREIEQIKLTFQFGKPGELTVIAKHDDNSLTMKCEYTYEKDTVKAKLKSSEVKGEFGFNPDKSYTFQFKIAIKGDKAKISDFDASEGADTGRQVVEGEYTRADK